MGAAPMSTWMGVVLTCVGCYVLKLLGLVLPERYLVPLGRVAEPLPVALLAALVAVSTFDRDRGLALDARAAGVAVAVVLVWRRAPLIAVVVAAGATAALLRAVA
jgi:branched-subunit amino acid transport protein